MRHRAKFREDQSKRSGDMADFQSSRWRPSAILDFQKSKILTSGAVWRPNMCHHFLLVGQGNEIYHAIMSKID